MASASQSGTAPTVGYYDDYSDPEQDPGPSSRRNVKEEAPETQQEGSENDYEEDQGQGNGGWSPSSVPPEYGAKTLKRKVSGAHPSVLPKSSHAPNGDGPAPKKPRPEPLEASILNAEPLDEFIMEIADWIHGKVQGRSNVEVEAKVGRIVDTRSNDRVNLPVLNETILAHDYPEIRFASDMTMQQHVAYNQALNKLVQASSLPSYTNARIRYEHTKVIDAFYSQPGGGGRVRVTTDEKTGKVKECVQKTRIADLNVYSPKRKMDWRVSVSTEVPVPIPSSSTPVMSRKKDRLSYAHQSFKVDLTQVASSESPELVHELEIEFADSAELSQLAKARMPRSSATWSGKEGEAFDELIRVFVNNVRILVRNAG